VKFGAKGTGPNRKDARFMFHMRRAVQSALAYLLIASESTSYIGLYNDVVTSVVVSLLIQQVGRNLQ